MSGGSYEYADFKINQWAEQVARDGTNPRRLAMRKLLLKVALAMHQLEWVDSGDSSPGDENEAIEACFEGEGWKIAAYDELLERLETITKSGRKEFR